MTKKKPTIYIITNSTFIFIPTHSLSIFVYQKNKTIEIQSITKNPTKALK